MHQKKIIEFWDFWGSFYRIPVCIYILIFWLIFNFFFVISGRSFLHIPQDLGANLKADVPPEKCFIPKRQIHEWKGHSKGIVFKKMVFCYQNCSDLLWEKIVLVIEKNFLKILISLEQFIQTVKGQNNFW